MIEGDGSYTLCWDIAKYINHCCHYNTMSTGYGFVIAVRDIAAGEEITEDYGPYNLPEPMELECHYPDCRRYARADDFDLYLEQWDDDIRQALRFVRSVPQPLQPYIDQQILVALDKYLDSGEGYRSIQRLRYPPNP